MRVGSVMWQALMAGAQSIRCHCGTATNPTAVFLRSYRIAVSQWHITWCLCCTCLLGEADPASGACRSIYLQIGCPQLSVWSRVFDYLMNCDQELVPDVVLGCGGLRGVLGLSVTSIKLKIDQTVGVGLLELEFDWCSGIPTEDTLVIISTDRLLKKVWQSTFILTCQYNFGECLF